MVNWDPGSRSAISDLEVENREVEDTLYSIDYPVEGSDRVLTVATVRPETMLADTAVAVNPGDERYADLVGKSCVLPLVGRRLPIIADEHVDPEFGTGALKITPGHDPNDFEIGRKHGLEEIVVIGPDGRLTEEAGEFAGMTAAEAQEAVVAALREQGRLRAEEPYVHSVPFSHRSGERIEPLISLQWFCRMDELARPAIEAVERDEVRIVPAQWKRVYLDWMREIRPWCISRQLWWGHRIPVWYCDACEETIVAEEPPERCGACGGELRQEEDVLDTWFSSAIWPFATLGWPDDTPELRAFYPTSFLTTAREILFLWVARMIMTGIEFAGDVPFRDVYVHSVIQARDGRRMSKSLGTGIDPLEEIDVHGADALRFGLLAMSSTQDVRFSDAKVEQGRDLANKLWNASRLILLNAAAVEPAPRPLAGRGPLDPLAAGADDRLGHGEARRLRLRPRGPGGLLLLLVATSATGTWRSSSRASTTARRRSRRRCSGRWSGCWRCCTRRCRSSPRRSGPSTRPAGATSPSHPFPAGRRVAASTTRRRPTWRAGIGLTQRLRAWRDLVDVAGRERPRRPRRRRRRHQEFVARLARFEFSRGRRRAGRLDRPGARAPLRPSSTPRRSRRAWGSAARSCAPRSSGPSANSATRASSPRRRPRWSRRSAASSSATGPNSPS